MRHRCSFLMCNSIFVGLLAGTLLAIPASLRAQTQADSVQSTQAAPASQEVTELQKVVDRWDDAVGQHDQYGLELVLAPQFVDITDTGEVMNRDQVVSDMVRKGKDAEHYTLTQKVVSARVIGDVAIVNGTYDREYPGSRLSRVKPKQVQGVFSQVYVRARNSWECVNSQRTEIAESTVKSNKKKKSRYSDREKPLHHDLGFHLPGMPHSNGSSTAGSQPQS